jgi:hypothetical protein
MKPWKIQKFFGDVVYDLRSRGLLPIAILLVVAMLAVPLLITHGSSSESSGSSLQPTAEASDAASETQPAVVSYNPGIRDYRKRLDDLSPKNPFRQQFAQSAAKASQLESTATPASASTGTSSTAIGTPTGSSDTPASTGGSSNKSKKKKQQKSFPTTYSYSLNVMAGDVTIPLTPFDNVPALTPLPGPTTPVVVYYGLSSDNAKALFLVSNKASGLTGPGTCLPAPDDCALLALAPGQSEDMLYGVDGKTYRVVVAEIKRSAN